MARDAENDRKKRKRPADNSKDEGIKWSTNGEKREGFNTIMMEFGNRWQSEYKRGNDYPSLLEVMEGIVSWHVRQTEERMKGKAKSAVKGVIRQTRTT